MNHSCNPNLGFEGDHQLITLRDIPTGEELTFDYAMSSCHPELTEAFPCHCSTACCRKIVTALDYRKLVASPEKASAYHGHYLSPVQKLIDLERKIEELNEEWTEDFGHGIHYSLHKKIQLQPHPNPIVGKGIFATGDIRKGEIVWREISRFSHPKAFEGVSEEIKKVLLDKDQITSVWTLEEGKSESWRYHYGYQIGPNEWSAPSSRENVDVDSSNFMNHSCDPTSGIFVSSIFVALKDIKEGDEITYDYATSECFHDRIPSCLCGAARCRGAQRATDWKLPELRLRYGLHWSSHILEAIFQEQASGGR
jgi:hypothetical protein